MVSITTDVGSVAKVFQAELDAVGAKKATKVGGGYT